MARIGKHRTPKAAAGERDLMVLASRGREQPVSIDLDELQHAREDEKLGDLLAAAEAEGVCVEREGRQRW